MSQKEGGYTDVLTQGHCQTLKIEETNLEVLYIGTKRGEKIRVNFQPSGRALVASVHFIFAVL